MTPEARFLGQPKAFWANVRLISQDVKYTNRRTKQIKVPTISEIRSALEKRDLDSTHLIGPDDALTPMGGLLCDYFDTRARKLNTEAEPHLMDAPRAKKVFETLRKRLNPTVPVRMNLQKGKKRRPSYLTNTVNFLVEAHSGKFSFDHDPQALTMITRDGAPLRTLARRLDGAFPSLVNPIAVWETKEYYYTTTFGSRIADGVYESLLDGLELEELRETEGIEVKHYLMVDGHYTWWDGGGRPYLCRIFDMLHMGYVDEVLFGEETVDRLPTLVKQWVRAAQAASPPKRRALPRSQGSGG